MKKTIANITLTLLLAMPVLSLITTLLPVERQKMDLACQSAFPGDGEDQQDDSDPTKSNEMDQDSEFLMEKYSWLPMLVCLKQWASSRTCLFIEHHGEVGTPPPKM